MRFARLMKGFITDGELTIVDAAKKAHRMGDPDKGPVVKSGRRAADAIVHDRDFTLDDVARYSAGN